MQNPELASDSLMLFAHLCRLKPDVKVLADIPAEINRKAKEKASARHLVKSARHQLNWYPRESIRPTQSNVRGYRLHTMVQGGKPIVTQIDEIHEVGARGTSSRGPSQPADRRHSGGKGKRPESRNAEGRYSGQGLQGKGKSKDTSRDAGPRPSAMDSAFDRPEYGVSAAFVFFKFSDEALTRISESEIYDKISREISWNLRHSGWTHADQSLTVFELMAGARFRKLLSVWAHTCHAKEDLAFPAVQKAQLQPWCEASVDRINLLLPLAITIMYNQKGRYQVCTLSTSDHQKGERFISIALVNGSIQPV